MFNYYVLCTIKYNLFDVTVFRAFRVCVCGNICTLLLLLCWTVVYLTNVHHAYLYIYCCMFRPNITAVIQQFHNHIEGSHLR